VAERGKGEQHVETESAQRVSREERGSMVVLVKIVVSYQDETERKI